MNAPKAPIKKTKHARRELALGWLMMLIAGPIIAFSLLYSLSAVLSGAVLTASNWAGLSLNPGVGATLLLVYGTLTALLFWLLWRFGKRSRALWQRMRDIAAEQNRAANLVAAENRLQDQAASSTSGQMSPAQGELRRSH